MSEGGYKIRNEAGVHFVTFAVAAWVDVFTRKEYRDIVVDSIRYCQKEKGLILHGWCLVSNHMHMVISAAEQNTSAILRDFKKYTSKQIVQAVMINPQESRKERMLRIFEQAGTENSRNTKYQFWRQDNQPKESFTERFCYQKLEYIHRNPVQAGIVDKAADYLYSSVRDYYGTGKGLLDIVKL